MNRRCTRFKWMIFFVILIITTSIYCPSGNAFVTLYVPSSYSTISAAVTAASNGDTIDITGSITEATINVSKNLVIRGHGTSTIVNNSSGSQAVFNFSSGTSKIMDMTVRNGRYGIYVTTANLTILNCTVKYNSYNGIYCSTTNSSYTLNILNSEISNNGSSAITGGAGIYNSWRGTLLISNSNIINNSSISTNRNYGGGIYCYNYANLTLSNCNVTGNTVSGGSYNFGGGIYLEMYSTATITSCNINNNTASSGSYNFGGGFYGDFYSTCTLSFCNINGNSCSGSGGYSFGGGVCVEGSGTTIINIGNCLISNNTVNGSSYSFGGGVYIDYGVSCLITNSTIYKNRIINGGPYTFGGGIYVDGYCAFNNCTITENSIYRISSTGWTNGGGIYSSSSTNTVLKNTILANNLAQGINNKDIYGTFTSYGYNLIRQNPASGSISTDIIGSNPSLDTLNNNGGPTMTLALLSGSPAINTASNTDMFGNIVLFDQRNSRRTSLNDIGAYEKNNSVEQDTNHICSNRQNLTIVRIEFSTVDTAEITSFTFSTNGTTTPSEILNAKVFCTGSSTTFTATNQFGHNYASPNGTFIITDSMKIRGINNFWLTYDVSPTAIAGHHFDASIIQAHVDTSTYIPDISSPPGYRRIPITRAVFTLNDSTQCKKGNLFVFNNNSSSNSGALNYKWYFGDNSNSTLLSPTHNYLLADTFDIKLVVKTNEGCADSCYAKAYVFPNPLTRFTINDSTQCEGANLFAFNNSSSISSGTIDSFYWNFGDNTSARTRNSQHTYITAGTFTVKLVAKSDNFCTDTVLHKTYVYPAPLASFSVNDSAQCFRGNRFVFTNKSSISPKEKLSYAWNFGDLSADTATNPVHSYKTVNNFTTRLIVTSTMGCQDTFSANMIVKTSANSSFSINDSIQCSAFNRFVFTNLSGGNTSSKYKWKFGDSQSDTSKNSAHKYLNSGSYTVYLISSDISGCKDSSRHTAIVNPSPVADFIVNDSNQCFHGNNFLLTDKTTGVTKHSRNWYFGDGLSDTINKPAHVYAKRGVYNVSLVVKSDQNCLDTAVKQFIVKASPVAAFNINDSTQCLAANSFSFTNNSVIDTGNMLYKWSFDDGTSVNLLNPLHSYVNSGSYKVRLLAISNNSCSDSVFHTMLVSPSPIAGFSINDSNQCLDGNSFLFTNNTTGVTKYKSGWDFGDGINDSLKNAIHSYSKKGSYRVSLVVKSDFDCFDTIIKQVYVKSSPLAAFTVNDSTQCLKGNSFVLTNKSSIDSGTLAYKWDFGDANIDNTQNPTHSYLNSGNYNLSLTAISVQACSTVVHSEMKVFSNLNPVIHADDTSLCFKGNLFSFRPLVINPLSKYQWDAGDGNTDSLTQFKHHYANSGDFQVKLTETSKDGCGGSSKQNIHVLASPVAVFNVNDSVQCLNGNLFTFRNTGSPGIKSCDWIFGDGNSAAGNIVSHSYLTDLIFKVKLVVSSNEGCTDTVQSQVKVDPQPKADFTVNDSSQCISGNQFDFNNKSDAGSVSFKWLFGDGNLSILKSPSHSYLNTASFAVQLIAYSSDNCFDTITKTVRVKPIPSAPLATSNSPVCLGGKINLDASSAGNVSYLWTSARGFKSNLQSPVISSSVYADSGDYYVKCILDGCESPASKVNVSILSLPTIQLGKDSSLCPGDYTLLDPGVFLTYLWQDNSTSRLYHVTSPGTYFVTVANYNHCTASDTIVFLNKCPTYTYIPDAFTANGDSLNETFRIIISNISEYQLKIFNRWGLEIFSSNDPSVCWDGKYKGNYCEIGYYYYSLSYHEELGTFKAVNGKVLLIR